MSVDDPITIDIVGIGRNGEVTLTISDHQDWCDNIKHQTILQTKINTYLRFVESGEILQVYPEAKNRPVAIRVVFKFAPDRMAQEFLKRVQMVIEPTGIHFCYELFAVSYDN